MGWFKRQERPATERRADGLHRFWRDPPFRTDDPGVMYQAGISAVTSSDGPGMLRVGWALWRMGGFHQNQASDFLRDGLQEWRDSGTCDPAQERAFLEDCFDGVEGSGPGAPPDVWHAPPEVVEPAAAHQGLRCWVASELIEVLGRDDPAELRRQERRYYRAIASSRNEFVPARSQAWARAFAQANGFDQPWTPGATLPDDEPEPAEDGEPPAEWRAMRRNLATFARALAPLTGTESVGRAFGEGLGLEGALEAVEACFADPAQVRDAGSTVAVNILMEVAPEDLDRAMGAPAADRGISPEAAHAANLLASAARSFLGQFDEPGANMWELWRSREDVAAEFLCWHAVAWGRLAAMGKVAPL